MPNIHSSAGVYVREIDLSDRINAVASSIAAIVGPSSQGPVNQRTLVTNNQQFTNLFGNPDASLTFMHYCALAYLSEGNRLYVTRVAPDALQGAAKISIANGLNAATHIAAQDATTVENYGFANADVFMVYAENPGAWNANINVRLIPNTKVDDGTFYVEVYVGTTNQPNEKFLVHLNHKIDGFGVQLNIQEHINRRSNLIRIIQNETNTSFVANPNAIIINTINSFNLTGGTDGSEVTDSDIINAWDLYKDPEAVDVNLLINGGITSVAVQRAMAGLAKDRMDCMAILDTPSTSQVPSGAIGFRRNTLSLDNNYAALYSPDVLILDTYNDRRLYVPPSGHIAAAYARTDRDYQLWFAPAGMNRGVMDVLGVRKVYDQDERDILYDSQVNALRVIAGAGIRIWGADTLQTKASALSNVSVRRLMMFIEKSISIATMYGVFDPNDEVLRARLVEITERFLKPIRDARGIYKYQAICDSSNNPPEVIANGDLNLDVYIDPVLPAKRIHLTAIVTKTGTQFSHATSI